MYGLPDVYGRDVPASELAGYTDAIRTSGEFGQVAYGAEDIGEAVGSEVAFGRMPYDSSGYGPPGFLWSRGPYERTDARRSGPTYRASTLGPWGAPMVSRKVAVPQRSLERVPQSLWYSDSPSYHEGYLQPGYGREDR